MSSYIQGSNTTDLIMIRCIDGNLDDGVSSLFVNKNRNMLVKYVYRVQLLHRKKNNAII